MTADTVGGVFDYSLELCRALASFGVGVTLATMGAPLSSAQWKALRALPNVDVHESQYRLEWMEDPWADVARASTWLLDLEAMCRPELVHLNQYVFGATPFRAPRLLVGHSCVWSWFEAVKGTTPPPSFERYRQEVTLGLARAERVVAPSRAMASALERFYGRRQGVMVIPNARDPEVWTPGPKAQVIFAAGRLWDEAKNVSALARIAARLPWPVRVAGAVKGPFGNTFTPNGVTLLGVIPPEAIAREMAAAAIYALPARYEPFGLSVLEAALCGCALVLGDIPSLRELWDGAALFVPPDDTDALFAALCRLAASKIACAEAGQRARAHALRYGPRRMVDGYLSVYASLGATQPDASGPSSTSGATA
ncbi:MAG: glycosyltransferase family 4 protein [Myxococcaceae bacterium]|nr:glycosyltransferase family 4 protein [Myxococcaceae bacterium]